MLVFRHIVGISDQDATIWCYSLYWKLSRQGKWSQPWNINSVTVRTCISCNVPRFGFSVILLSVLNNHFHHWCWHTHEYIIQRLQFFSHNAVICFLEEQFLQGYGNLAWCPRHLSVLCPPLAHFEHKCIQLHCSVQAFVVGNLLHFVVRCPRLAHNLQYGSFERVEKFCYGTLLFCAIIFCLNVSVLAILYMEILVQNKG